MHLSKPPCKTMQKKNRNSNPKETQEYIHTILMYHFRFKQKAQPDDSHTN